MERKLALSLIMIFLLTSLLGVMSRIEKVHSSGTIYIRADGSIDPSTANITSVDNVTYTFTDHNYDSIVVERDNIVIDGVGYTLQGTGSGYGVVIFGRNNITLRNTEINAFDDGVYLSSSSNNTISGNNITNTIAGVYLSSSSNNTISGNNITANYEHGVSLSSSSNYNTVSGNYITNNDVGIWLSASYNITISGNSFVADGLLVSSSSGNVVVDNLVNGKPLVYLEDGSDLVVEDAGQVILVNCNRIRVENLTLSNAVVGIQLCHTSNTTITGNTITTNNRDGVYFISLSNYNTISGNTITTNNYSGVRLRSSYSNTISGNTITTNNRDGVSLYYSSHNTVTDNTITNNGDGVHIYYSSNHNTVSSNYIANSSVGVRLSFNLRYNAVIGNNIVGNDCGVLLDYASSNIVSNNNIVANSKAVVLYPHSSNNTIYHNNIINDHQVIISTYATSKWDNGCEGNFWSDFAGSDSDGDGIGDTPYIIDVDNQDNYPLMYLYWNPADINHDLEVDMFDVDQLCDAYYSTLLDSNWNCHCDLIEPYGLINIFDVVMVCVSYGEEYAP